ncbi:hypothetical protein Ccrd_013123 [Cynara cardunculus var. scolymus]|uniref:Ribosomal protein S24/S35 mitochondrial conserved domain-containing protein n=1 Tax=Cynara cardunculus var. scolymus TaxID=59895 RepID=A0A118K543_CYNCS|nr:hypothetical protein Ccrd_013123 [Cynara cardunculus var. scolymus]
MRRALLNKITVRYLLTPPPPPPSRSFTPISKINHTLFGSFRSKIRFFSTENGDSSIDVPNPASEKNSIDKPPAKQLEVEDVSNKELKMQIEKYFNEKDEEALPAVFESIIRRKVKGKHSDTDDELLEEFRMQPIDSVNDKEFESDFEEIHETDDEIDNLYDAKDILIKRMTKNEFFYMDDRKWEGMIKEATDTGHVKDTKECEEILQDMFMWEKLLPDLVETGELEPEAGYEIYQEFEHNMLMKHVEEMEKAGPPKFDDEPEKKDVDDPPGDGPILRWQTRVVFVPGGESWHPKNRKAKLAVTLKELGLSKNQFEHREENRKDCLRTLLGLIEEAAKADKLVDDVRTSYVKNRLRANDKFMEKLNAKIMRKQGSNVLHA